jgi:hypothetical protein
MSGDQELAVAHPESDDEFGERLRRIMQVQEECQRAYVWDLLRHSLMCFAIAAAGVLVGYVVWWSALRPAFEEPPLPPPRSDPAATRTPF